MSSSASTDDDFEPRKCSACFMVLTKHGFSKSAWSAPSDERRCRECAEGPGLIIRDKYGARFYSLRVAFDQKLFTLTPPIDSTLRDIKKELETLTGVAVEEQVLVGVTPREMSLSDHEIILSECKFRQKMVLTQLAPTREFVKEYSVDEGSSSSQDNYGRFSAREFHLPRYVQDISLLVDGGPFVTGSTIRVTWSAPGARLKGDWIGLCKIRSPSYRCQPSEGKEVPVDSSSGVLKFTATRAGKYEFRYHLDETTTAVARSEPFIIRPNGAPKAKYYDELPEISFITWNIEHVAPVDTTSYDTSDSEGERKRKSQKNLTRARYKRILKILKNCDADIICLQEVDEAFVPILTGARWVQKNYYLADIDKYWYHYRLEDYSDWKSDMGAMYILSKVPLLDVYYRKLTSEQNRGLLVAVLEGSDGRTFAIGSCWLDSAPAAGDMRVKQLAEATAELNLYDEAALMGDFNFGDNGIAQDWNAGAPNMLYEDMWEVLRPNDPGLTWDMEKNKLAVIGAFLEEGECSRRLDRIMVRMSREWRPVSITMIGTKELRGRPGYYPSDHFGLVGTVGKVADPSLDSSQPFIEASNYSSSQ